jgi:hypothetical protein
MLYEGRALTVEALKAGWDRNMVIQLWVHPDTLLLTDLLCRPGPWDWTFCQGKCYFFSNSKRNWNDAVTACQEVEA